MTRKRTLLQAMGSIRCRRFGKDSALITVSVVCECVVNESSFTVLMHTAMKYSGIWVFSIKSVAEKNYEMRDVSSSYD